MPAVAARIPAAEFFDKEGKDNGKNRPDPNVKARAEGQSQFDYLQRLGDRVRQLDAQLRLQGDRGIEAVGVLGSDLYDKLLVLQALRPLLPEARFFTTDFDALLLHPDEQKVTGNLLVGFGFGLQLRLDVQGTIPPFRSNYQTAEFLAARVAIHSDNAPNPCWSKPSPDVRDRSVARIPVCRNGSASFRRVQARLA